MWLDVMMLGARLASSVSLAWPRPSRINLNLMISRCRRYVDMHDAYAHAPASLSLSVGISGRDLTTFVSL